MKGEEDFKMIRETPKPRYSLGMESGVLYFWPKAHFSLNLWTDDHEKQSFRKSIVCCGRWNNTHGLPIARISRILP